MLHGIDYIYFESFIYEVTERSTCVYIQIFYLACKYF